MVPLSLRYALIAFPPLSNFGLQVNCWIACQLQWALYIAGLVEGLDNEYQKHKQVHHWKADARPIINVSGSFQIITLDIQLHSKALNRAREQHQKAPQNDFVQGCEEIHLIDV
eukprot:TRINITY_DN10702_c0_g1_i2.p4 TRINITY_DN10702_c0_g1~~TRINITY_DN10702_c0_g1_i2.p4  ORF type:complete len:113 (+),score=11.60 TRINITY_DN10702_c0_g1_i2:1055-1393(+)